jgi:imidazolonepropionase
MRTLLTNIKTAYLTDQIIDPNHRIAGVGMNQMPSIADAWILFDNASILDYGCMTNLGDFHYDKLIELNNQYVYPAWCDSHTHLVFAATREQEFVDRILGKSYEEIARNGGGILNSAEKLRKMDETELYEQAMVRLHEVIQQGTGAIEIKSGYGLTTESELKMLRVIRKIKESAPIPVKSSFLAAHAYPIEFRENKPAYLRLIIDEMLPLVADQGLADYIDAFCEKGFFSVEDTEILLEAAAKYGLKAKIHANQLHYSGGVQLGVKHGAVSVDHLECVGEAEINALKNTSTMPTLLPAAAFFLGIQYQPARKIIDAGLPVCLASDYNPGTCPSGNMNLLTTIACTQLKMTPTEAIHSITINGAAALEMANEIGSIAIGKKPNFIISKPGININKIPYDFGSNPVQQMIINGKIH